MALSNQSAPAFFLSPAKLLKGFCKSCEMALAIEKKGPPHSPQPNNSGRLLIENGQIPAYAKLELARPRNIHYRDLVSPASQFAKFQ
jgi:hypothetical protein